MDELVLREQIEIAASPARVWQVLTEPVFTRRYMFGCEPVTRWEVGTPLEWRGELDGERVTFVKGVVLAFEPLRRLEYTVFGVGMQLAETPANYVPVAIRLVPRGLGTRLEITQGDFAGAERGRERYDDARAAWPSTLEKLRAVAEEGGAVDRADAGA